MSNESTPGSRPEIEQARIQMGEEATEPAHGMMVGREQVKVNRPDSRTEVLAASLAGAHVIAQAEKRRWNLPPLTPQGEELIDTFLFGRKNHPIEQDAEMVRNLLETYRREVVSHELEKLFKMAQDENPQIKCLPLSGSHLNEYRLFAGQNEFVLAPDILPKRVQDNGHLVSVGEARRIVIKSNIQALKNGYAVFSAIIEQDHLDGDQQDIASEIEKLNVKQLEILQELEKSDQVFMPAMKEPLESIDRFNARLHELFEMFLKKIEDNPTWRDVYENDHALLMAEADLQIWDAQSNALRDDVTFNLPGAQETLKEAISDFFKSEKYVATKRLAKLWYRVKPMMAQEILQKLDAEYATIQRPYGSVDDRTYQKLAYINGFLNGLVKIIDPDLPRDKKEEADWNTRFFLLFKTVTDIEELQEELHVRKQTPVKKQMVPSTEQAPVETISSEEKLRLRHILESHREHLQLLQKYDTPAHVSGKDKAKFTNLIRRVQGLVRKVEGLIRTFTESFQANTDDRASVLKLDIDVLDVAQELAGAYGEKENRILLFKRAWEKAQESDYFGMIQEGGKEDKLRQAVMHDVSMGQLHVSNLEERIEQIIGACEL
ncbi:MAG: hypothetical protein NUV84_04000 [Candidatus Uhrbacteria bacterium]|nr:hypothetical protein [Candidatus Uhrbacteria bacterium]